MRAGNRSRDEALDIVKKLLNNRIVCGDHDGSEFDPVGRRRHCRSRRQR